MQRLGPYEIQGELARGGGGVVYRAHDPALDRAVAIKVFRAHDRRDPNAQQRFLQEIRILGRLRHPHLIGVHAAALSDEGQPYMVMDLVEGGSLADRLEQQKTLPVEAAVEIASQLADALSYAHSEGVLHRDIKPANVLLSGDRGDHAVLTDFGVAKLLGEKSLGMTATGITVGTTVYMAPEQLRAEHDRIGPATDVYALGATLFEMLTGQLPYLGQDVAEVLERKQDALASSVRAVRPSIDAELEAIVSRCLAEDIADRFPTAEALRDRLRAWGAPAGAPPIRSGRLRHRLQGLALGGLIGVGLGLLTAQPLERARRGDVYSDELPPAMKARFHRGVERYRRDDPAGAIEDMTAVIEAEPNCSAAHNLRGRAFKDLERASEAQADLARAIAIDPSYAEAYTLRAQLRGEVEESGADYDRSIALEPLQAVYVFNRAAWHFKRKRSAEALRDVQRALELDPRFGDAHRLLAILRDQANDPLGALAACAEGLRYQPKDAELLHIRGILREKRGNHRGAVADFTAAISAKLELASFHSSRAKSLTSLERLNAALSDCDVALQVDPEHPSSLQNRAVILLQLRRWSEGALALERAARALPPNSPERAKLERSALSLREAVQEGKLVVEPRSIEMRIGPGKGYKVLADLSQGSVVKSLGVEGEWTHVRVKDAKGNPYEGYVLSNQLSLVVPGLKRTE